MNRILRLTRYLWALPNTLLGVLFVPLVIVTRGRMEIVDGVLELRGRMVATLLKRCVPIQGGAAAITFGHIVVGQDRAALDATRTHERVHVRQCERWGPAFVPAYLLAAAWAALAGRGAYRGNYFERQAFEHCESRRVPWARRSSVAFMLATLPGGGLAATAVAQEEMWPTDRWVEAAPESQGMDSGVLAAMLEHARERQLPLHSLLIVRHGRVLMDATVYPYDGKVPHDIASATKSVMSLLIGIAIDKGYIKSVKQPLIELLSVPPSVQLDRSKARLNLEHLLTMRSGFDCGVQPGEKELAAMRRSEDWASFALALPMRTEPGVGYAYCSCNNHLLSAVLSARTGANAFSFARKHLFDPLGIKDVMWPSDPKGRSHGWGDLHLHPRDLAKIAFLYLHRGTWNGNQIVSETWVAESTRPHVSIRDGVGYGYSWWINTTRQPFVFEMIGRGGQRAAVVPDKDLVVVFSGGGVNTDELAPFLFKAVKSASALPVNENAARRLRRALEDVRRPPTLRPPSSIPDVARAISGKRYVVDGNPLNLQHVSLTFSGRNEAHATLTMQQQQWNLTVGLDGRYRFSPAGGNGLPVGARGHWSSPSEFVLDLNSVAGINHFTFRMRFVDERLDVTVDEATGEVKGVQLHGRAARR